jgi:hypothetical protein
MMRRSICIRAARHVVKGVFVEEPQPLIISPIVQKATFLV